MSEGARQPENAMHLHAEGKAKINAAGIVNAQRVDFGDRYENQCQLPPPVVENINYIPDDRDLDTWIDRELAQAELLRRVEAAQTVLVEIVAAGGFGKSALAVWVCEQTAGYRRQKAIWVSLAKASRFHAFARWVLYELCVPTDDQMPEKFLIDQLIFHLRKQPRLVVIDQLEMVAETEEQPFFSAFLAKWQQKGSASTVLVTARPPVWSSESACLELLGFDSAEGADFLQKRGVATAIMEGLPKLSDICGGHPLLLNLSASWLQERAKGQLSEVDFTFFERLFENDIDDPEAQVAEIFEALLNALPTQLKTVLLEVSVYRLPFNLAQASAMQAAIARKELDTLEAQGFLLGQEDRWRLHPLVEQFVREALEQAGLEESTHRKAIDYFEAQLQAEKTDLQDYLECFHHYCECQEYESAYKTLDLCFSYLNLGGYYRVLLTTYKRLARAWQESSLQNLESQENFGIVLARLGNTYGSQGDYAKAIDLHQQSLEVHREIGDCNGIAGSLNNIGTAYYSQGDYAKAIDLHQQSLKICREIGDRNGTASSLNNIGTAYYSQRDYAKAIDLHQQSLEIHREIRYRNGVADSLGNIGNAYYSQGDYAKAIDFHQQSLEIRYEIGDRNGIASSLGNLGNIHKAQGDYDKAIDLMQQSLETKCKIGDRSGIANAFNNIGSAYYSQGNYDKAIDLMQQSLEIRCKIGDRSGQAVSLFNLGNAFAKTDDHWKSREHYEQAKALFTELKLAHMIEKCEKAIQERNRIIAMQPKKAPPLPTQTTEPDWLQKSMPQASSPSSTQTKRPVYKWLPYIAIATIIFGLILLLQ